MDDLLRMIGLAQRGGHLAVGEEPAGAACREKDCRLLLVAADAADNTRRRAESFAREGQCLRVILPCTREELGRAVGRGVCALAAVTDTGLALAVAERLERLDPAAGGEAANRLRLKAERARQRRAARGDRRGGKAPGPYVPTRVKRARKQQGK